MSVAVLVFRVAVVVAIIGGAIALLPDAPAELPELVIPSVIWTPLLGVLALNRYFPISELLVIAGLALSIRVGMFGVFVYGWLSKHVLGGS